MNGKKFGNLSFPNIRKLNALALTKLLECNQRWVLVKLQDLFTTWTDVITELRAENDNE